MPDVKISQLPAVPGGTEIQGTDVLPMNVGGVTRRPTVLALLRDGIKNALAFIQIGAGAVARSPLDKMRDTFTTNDYATVQQALTAAAGRTLHVFGAHTITAALLPESSTTVVIEAGATITTATHNIDHFYVNGKTNVTIKGPGRLQRTSAGTSAYFAGVHLRNSTGCKVLDLNFEGMQWAGVWLDNASNNEVIGNSFTAAIGTVQDAADIMVWESSHDNTITRNRCLSGCHTGIMVQDPYTGLVPKRNKIGGNWAQNHSAYGIACYLPAATDSFNVFDNNYVENITGLYAANRDSGTGIYLVGAGAGGTKITNNTIRDACKNTLTRTLAPAGIGVNGVSTGAIKPLIEGNTISGMTQGDGILITSCPGGVVIGPNTVLLPTTNDGSGPGGVSLRGSGLRIEASSNVDITGGSYETLAGGYGGLIFANGSTLSSVRVDGGSYQSATGYGFSVTRVASETINDIQIGGSVRISSAGPDLGGLQLNGVTDGTVTGTIARSAAPAALVHNASTGICYAGCSFKNTGPVAIMTSGTCTGSTMDASNNWGTVASKMDNSGTGMRVEWRGSTSQPANGTWAVGDLVHRNPPAVGSPTRWNCTVAGTPGTWRAEANL